MDIGNGTRESHKSTNFIKTTKNKKFHRKTEKQQFSTFIEMHNYS